MINIIFLTFISNEIDKGGGDLATILVPNARQEKKKKGKKALSFKKKLEAAGGVLPGSGSATTENENWSEQNPESSLLASLMSTSKGKDKIVSDEVTEEVKEVADNLEDMNLTEYRQQQEKLKTREKEKLTFTKTNSMGRPNQLRHLPL